MILKGTSHTECRKKVFGLQASGGAIVPEKAHRYLIDFIWQQGNWKYVTLKHRYNSAFATVIGTVAVLGVKLAPDGNDQAPLSKLLVAA
jgi:hypothetical protein